MDQGQAGPEECRGRWRHAALRWRRLRADRHRAGVDLAGGPERKGSGTIELGIRAAVGTDQVGVGRRRYPAAKGPGPALPGHVGQHRVRGVGGSEDPEVALGRFDGPVAIDVNRQEFDPHRGAGGDRGPTRQVV